MPYPNDSIIDAIVHQNVEKMFALLKDESTRNFCLTVKSPLFIYCGTKQYLVQLPGPGSQEISPLTFIRRLCQYCEAHEALKPYAQPYKDIMKIFVPTMGIHDASKQLEAIEKREAEQYPEYSEIPLRLKFRAAGIKKLFQENNIDPNKIVIFDFASNEQQLSHPITLKQYFMDNHALSMFLELGADPNSVKHSHDDGQLCSQTCVPLLHEIITSKIQNYRMQKLTDLLLLYGANPNLKNNQGNTPLHLAVKYPEDTNLIETLLNHGADPLIKNAAGISPLILAAQKRVHKIVLLLLESILNQIKNKESLTLEDENAYREMKASLLSEYKDTEKDRKDKHELEEKFNSFQEEMTKKIESEKARVQSLPGTQVQPPPVNPTVVQTSDVNILRQVTFQALQLYDEKNQLAAQNVVLTTQLAECTAALDAAKSECVVAKSERDAAEASAHRRLVRLTQAHSANEALRKDIEVQVKARRNLEKQVEEQRAQLANAITAQARRAGTETSRVVIIKEKANSRRSDVPSVETPTPPLAKEVDSASKQVTIPEGGERLRAAEANKQQSPAKRLLESSETIVYTPPVSPMPQTSSVPVSSLPQQRESSVDSSYRPVLSPLPQQRESSVGSSYRPVFSPLPEQQRDPSPDLPPVSLPLSQQQRRSSVVPLSNGSLPLRGGSPTPAFEELSKNPSQANKRRLENGHSGRGKRPSL